MNMESHRPSSSSGQRSPEAHIQEQQAAESPDPLEVGRILKELRKRTALLQSKLALAAFSEARPDLNIDPENPDGLSHDIHSDAMNYWDQQKLAESFRQRVGEDNEGIQDVWGEVDKHGLRALVARLRGGDTVH